MRRGLIALCIAALAAFVGALVTLEARDDPARPDVPAPAAAMDARPSPVDASSPAPPPAAPEVSPSVPPGFRLGKHSGPDARVKAQAILDDTLAELRRLDSSHKTLARDLYMRGHSAAERVQDEIDDDDEPGLAELRAHEDAMKAELRRIYGAQLPTERP